MGKYDRLGAFLRSQFGDEVPMSFDEIEAVLGAPLPPSARAHRPWWSNNADNSAMTRAWLKAGFRTARVDMAAERLVFLRDKEVGTVSGPPGFDEAMAAGGSGKRLSRHPAIGSMKGMITIMPGVDLTEPADAEWVDRLHDAGATAGDLVGGLDETPVDRK